VRNTARSTFKGIHVGQSAKPFCSSDKLHPLSAAWAKRWRGLEIVSVFVAHKRNSVFEPLAKWDRYITGELLRGYWEIADGLIFGNRRSAASRERSIHTHRFFTRFARECPRSSTCIDQNSCRFADTYCGEAAKRFWGYPPRHRPKFKNDRRPLTQRLRSNNKIIEAAKSVASNKQINASNKKIAQRKLI
jgi:hypothetical protein